MQRWMLPVVLSALIAAAIAWLFATEQGEEMRRQLTKQGQLLLEQAGQTVDQVNRQVQSTAQDVLDSSRRLVNDATK